MRSAPAKFSRLKMMGLCVLSLLLLAFIDHITGYEFVFSAAYLLPVALCAWNFGRGAILGMAAASAFATWFVDIQSDHPYSHYLFPFWNSFTCFIISAVTGLLLHRLKLTLTERQKTNSELKEALAKLEQSTEEIRKLQNGLQVVCAWTKRIKVGDRWMTPDEFLQSQLHLKLTHGMSPEATKAFEAELKRRADYEAGSRR